MYFLYLECNTFRCGHCNSPLKHGPSIPTQRNVCTSVWAHFITLAVCLGLCILEPRKERGREGGWEGEREGRGGGGGLLLPCKVVLS